MHLETISYSATAPGAAGAAAAALAGDSLTVKNSKRAGHMLALWGCNQTAGWHQLVFPSAHDTTRGFRANVDLNVDDRLTPGVGMTVEPQELLTVSIAGSATAGDVESGSILMYYGDLPGVTSRMMSWADLLRRTEKITTVSCTLAAAAAGYGTSELINAESDLLRANRDYAVLGITTNTKVATVSLRGPDTGYQRVSCPGNPDDSQVLQEWFCKLSRAYNRPLIPVINSGNRNDTKLDFVSDENVPTPLITVFLALLSKGA